MYERLETVKSDLIDLVSTLKSNGSTIAGFGAARAGTTLLSYFGIGSGLDFLVDDNSDKHYKYSPGDKLQVLPVSEIYNKKPEFFRFFSQNLIKTLIGAKSMSPTPSAPVFFDSGILHRGTPPNIKKLGTLEGWDIENYHIPRNLGGGNKYAIYTQFGSQMAVDSYFYDRLRRKGNADEVKRWKEDISWLNDFDEANAAKALSLIPE